jgi:drug/metabolite transporter (DMT)-like permease
MFAVKLATMASLLALFSSALWGSADYHAGNLSKRFPAMVVLGINQFFGLLFGIFLILITGGWVAPSLAHDGYLFNGVLAGLTGYVGLLCLYAGLATGRMGVVSPVSSLSVLFPLFFAFIFKDERLTLPLTLGVIAAVIGGFLASGPEFSQGLPLRPLLLALGAACGFGATLILMSIGSQDSSLMTMVSMRSATFFITAGYFLHRRNFGGVQGKNLPLLILIGCADFLANLLLGVATTKGLVSLSMVLGSLYPIATAALAFIFLKERLHHIQYWGIALAVGGTSAIAAFQ